MKVAVIHDWLVTYAGAERVLEQILEIYPHADVFSVIDFLPDEGRAFIRNKRATTTFIQRLPFAARAYRKYLPLMPLAIEQLDLSGYDVVLSSSYAVAKGVLTGPDQLHLCYCHSPIRYAWDLQHQYLRESGLDRGLKGWLARSILSFIRLWDIRTANGVNGFIANSEFIARRIWKAYRRESTVIYPPVDVAGFQLREEKEDFYLIASRMVPYKRIDLVVEAFTAMPGRKLVVIGDGPDFDKIQAKAGRNVVILGYQDFSVLRDHMQRARAFVFAAEEDFGITPVEALACGTPVIAFGRGGALETVRGLDAEFPTGVLFEEQSVSAIIQAVDLFEQESERIHPEVCRESALRFSPERFRERFQSYVNQEVIDFAELRVVKKKPQSESNLDLEKTVGAVEDSSHNAR